MDRGRGDAAVTGGRDLEGLGAGLRRLVGRLGIGDLDILLELRDEWDEIAGPPWSGASRVVAIERGTVVVEANDPGSVSFLRYGEQALLTALEERFGAGVASSVRVISPSSRRR